jgi:hypothetical protein
VNEEMVYENNQNNVTKNNNTKKPIDVVNTKKVTPKPKVEPIKEKQDQNQNEIKKLSDKKTEKKNNDRGFVVKEKTFFEKIFSFFKNLFK